MNYNTMYKSAFCGRIDEIPGISVDNFENPETKNVRAYFLSHCHSDHTQGLYSEALIATLEKTGSYLYMSEPSAAIIEDEATDKRIVKYTQPLPLGKRLITLPGDPEQDLEEEYISVTLIPAGHCFGSVMFLFRTNCKTVLYTGDFRICTNDVSKYAQLHEGSDPITIDALYVDTTFIGHRYLHFPKRSESISSLIEEMRNHLALDCNRIALHVSARYGYEHVYKEIYDNLKTKVYVGDVRWQFYSKLLHLVPGVTNEENSTRIHLCKNMSEKKDHTKCLTNTHPDQNFLYIHFSAMKWDNYQIDDCTLNGISDKRIDVCFATHCSRSELLYFVKYLSPKRIVGFPNEYPKADIYIYRHNGSTTEITPRKRKNFSEPDIKVKDAKVDKELLKKIFEI